MSTCKSSSQVPHQSFRAQTAALLTPAFGPPDADKNFVNLMAKKEVIGENLFTAKCDLVRWLAGILLPNVVSRPNCGQPE